MHTQKWKWKEFNKDTVSGNGARDKGTKKIVNKRNLLARAKVDIETKKGYLYLAM